MKKAMILAGAALISVGLLSTGVQAQGVPQTVAIAKVNVQTLAAGYRASQVIGSNVANEAGDTIGKVDDVLVSSDGKQPYAVLSVGGFLGMGDRLVIVRYEELKFDNSKVTLMAGSKEGLKMLPEFKYATD